MQALHIPLDVVSAKEELHKFLAIQPYIALDFAVYSNANQFNPFLNYEQAIFVGFAFVGLTQTTMIFAALVVLVLVQMYCCCHFEAIKL